MASNPQNEGVIDADAKAPKATAKNPIPVPEHDRVAMASRLPDGTPDQTPGFEYVGPVDVAVAAAQEQLKVQAVSATDQALRSTATGNDEGNAPDPEVQTLKDAHEAAEKAASSAAEAEVRANHPEG